MSFDPNKCVFGLYFHAAPVWYTLYFKPILALFWEPIFLGIREIRDILLYCTFRLSVKASIGQFDLYPKAVA